MFAGGGSRSIEEFSKKKSASIKALALNHHSTPFHPSPSQADPHKPPPLFDMQP